jgi:DNA-binding MarR family transcriptional regulator
VAKPSVIDVKRLANVIEQLQEELGPDVSLRQVSILLHVSLGGESGIEQSTLQQKSDSSQATTSRNLKALGPGAGLVEYFVQQNDTRRALVRTTPAGDKLINSLIRQIQGK